MVARVRPVAFSGVEVVDVEAQVTITPGLPAFAVVGLPDKTVAESRERVRSALAALGLSLPSRHITVNLAPADVLKEGSHFDLPIALALLAAMDVLPEDELSGYTALRGGRARRLADERRGRIARGIDCSRAPERSHLPGRMRQRSGLGRRGRDHRRAEPSRDRQSFQRHTVAAAARAQARGAARSWARLQGRQRPGERQARAGNRRGGQPQSADDRSARRRQSMLAARLPGILPPLEPAEALELGMIQSVAGGLRNGGVLRERPFRDPHHSASLPALVGGGLRTRPGEISLAHQGVLFLDELPEFNRAALEALRQPLETGRVSVARANSHVTFPARVQLVAAMNPCRCGWLSEPGRACSRAPRCAQDYQAKISGPLLDRI